MIFSVDRVGREDYRVLGKGRDGPFAKSFFDGRVSVSLFRSDESTDSFLKIDICGARACECQVCDEQEKFQRPRQNYSLAAS
jgi:hypothetical protein